MHVGFTGTREGMTPTQMDTFAQMMSEIYPLFSFHHGDCLGADDQAANIMSELRQDDEHKTWLIVSHPPRDESFRAFNDKADEVMLPAPYLQRNRDIVHACDILFVLPKEMEPQPKGGTWYTHDYAIKRNTKVVIIYPNGATETICPDLRKAKADA